MRDKCTSYCLAVVSIWLAAVSICACSGSSSVPVAGDASTDTDTNADTDSDSGTDAGTDTDPTGCWWEQMESGMESGTEIHIGTVWGLSEFEVYAIYYNTDSGDSGVLRFDGSSWNIEWSFTSHNVISIWGFSSESIFLSLYDIESSLGEVQFYDGSTWSEVSGYSGGGGRLWGSSENDLYLRSGWRIWHYNGSDWAVAWEETLGGEDEWSASIYAIWGSASDDVFGVGVQHEPYSPYSGNYIIHYDGTEFTGMFDSYCCTCLIDVFGVSASAVYAVGNAEEFLDEGVNMSTVLEYDGDVWSQIGEFDYRGLRGVWANEDGEVFAVGQNVVLHYKDGVWEEMVIPVPVSLTDIWGTDIDNLYAVGLYGVILKYTCAE